MPQELNQRILCGLFDAAGLVARAFMHGPAHHAYTGDTMKRIVFVAIACLGLLGCGQKLSGAYVPKGDAFFEKLEFVSGDAVNVTFMTQTVQGSYKLDGQQLVITVNGQQQVFTIDGEGCIDGGNMIGKYCKA